MTLRKHLATLAKAAISLGLLAYLITDVRQSDPTTFGRLLAEPKRWELLIAAWTCFVGALGAGLWRWQRLSQSLGVAIGGAAAARIGVLAYMFDFAAFGAAGGDVFKAVSLARLHPERRAYALATVVADRAIGLGTLLLFASVWILYFEAWNLGGVLPAVTRAVLTAAVLGSLATGVLIALQRGEARWAAAVQKWRWIGNHLANLILAGGLVWRRPRALLTSIGLSLAVLLLNATGYALLAAGLPGQGPSWSQHLLIVPLASLSGLVPLPADTLGVLDYAMSYLYEQVTHGRSSAGFGMLVVMTYRAVGVAVTATGLVVYLAGGSTRPAPDEPR